MKKKKRFDKDSNETETKVMSCKNSSDNAQLKILENENLTSFKITIFVLSLTTYSATCYRSFPGGDSTELIGIV